MKFEIKRLTSQNSGSEIAVNVACFDDFEDVKDEKLIISTADYLELKLKKGEISEEIFEEINDRANFRRGLKKAESLLSYSQKSPEALYIKLVKSGFDKDIAARVISFITENSYINEKRDAVRIAEMCLKKFWGKKKILFQIREKGYGDIAIQSVKEFLNDIDFVERCLEYMIKKYEGVPKDPDKRNKMFLALMRYGYSQENIIDACARFHERNMTS